MASGGLCLSKCEVLPGRAGRCRVAAALALSLLALSASSCGRWCTSPQLAFLPLHSVSTSQGSEQVVHTLAGRLSLRTPASNTRLARLLQHNVLPHGRAKPTAREAEKETPSKAQAGDKDLVPGFILAGLATGVLSPLLLEKIPIASLLETLAVLWVMRGAAERSRLNGGTFRVLALGLAAAGWLIFMDSGVHLISAMSALMHEGFSLQAWRGLLPAFRVRLVALVASALAVPASYTALMWHGVPNFKTAVRNKESSMALTVVAFGLAVASCNHIVKGASQLFLGGNQAGGALRCCVAAASTHVCQTAAVAGAKRLSSPTYRTLNFALVVAGVLRAYTAKVYGIGLGSQVELVLSVAQSLLAAYAWAVGTAVASK